MAMTLTPAQLDAAGARGIGERLQSRGDAAVADLAFFLGRLIDDCDDVAARRSVATVLAGLTVQRTVEPTLMPLCPRCGRALTIGDYERDSRGRKLSFQRVTCACGVLVTVERVMAFVTEI